MGQLLLLLVVAVTVAAVVFGVTVLVTGRDPGLVPVEADGRAVPLPGDRPLRESDVGEVRFDTALRGYRMTQVDQAMRRAAYDIGYKTELIGVLEAEIAALRDGRTADADALRQAREQAANATEVATSPSDGPAADSVMIDLSADDPAFAGAGSGPEFATGPGAKPEPAAATEPAGRDARPTAEPSASDAEPTDGTESRASTGPTSGEEPTDGGAPESGSRGSVVRSESA